MLERDLRRLDDRLRDDKFAGELYRGLAGNRMCKDGEFVVLGWKQAEELVSALRVGVDKPPVEMFQTGGETWLTGTVRGELERLGWDVRQSPTPEG